MGKVAAAQPFREPPVGARRQVPAVKYLPERLA